MSTTKRNATAAYVGSNAARPQKRAKPDRPTASLDKCPYLDTVHRGLLDFDLPHVCKVTLSTQNVYACLVCGEFFRGRSPNSPAFLHAVNECHFVFLNLTTSRAFCLPEGYEIIDRSLDDVKHELKPTFSQGDIQHVRNTHLLKKDVSGGDYLPGYIGISNLKCTDATSVVVHALARVIPLQNVLLQNSKVLTSCRSQVFHQLAQILRRIWNPRAFKTFVGPYKLINALAQTSRNRFVVGKRPRCLFLLQWLLNHMHKYVVKSTGKSLPKGTQTTSNKASPKSIILECFQGAIQETVFSSASAGEQGHLIEKSKKAQKRIVPFFSVSLDLPKNSGLSSNKNGDRDASNEKSAIVAPETVSLYTLLQKFDSDTTPVQSRESNPSLEAHEHGKILQIASLPKYLFVHIKRFSKNNYVLEKNSTIVSLPLKNLDMRKYLSDEGKALFPDDQTIETMKVSELKALIKRCGGSSANILDRKDLIAAASAARGRSTKYDLVANICHRSNSTLSVSADASSLGLSSTAERNRMVQLDPHDAGSYYIHVRHKIGRQWYEIDDLRVQEIPSELISKSESLIMMFERQDVAFTADTH